MSAIPPDLEPTGRFEWERVLRRIEMPQPVKGTALLMATYANADGSSIHPGEDELALYGNVTNRTIRNHIKALREHYRMLFRTHFHGTSRVYSDTYQLVLPRELPVGVRLLVRLPDPSSHRKPVSGEDTSHRNSASGEQQELVDAHRKLVTASPETGFHLTGSQFPATTTDQINHHNTPTPADERPSPDVPRATGDEQPEDSAATPEFQAARAAMRARTPHVLTVNIPDPP